jgi:hypothetical protein
MSAVHRHPLLGAVTYVPSTASWCASSPVPLGGTDRVEVVLSVLDESDLPAGRLDEVAATAARLDPRALRHIVADDLLDLHNDTWCQDDDEILDRDGFLARIRPTLVDIDDDRLTVYFDDGGLFGGHSIVLTLDLDLEVLDVKLAG